MHPNIKYSGIIEISTVKAQNKLIDRVGGVKQLSHGVTLTDEQE